MLLPYLECTDLFLMNQSLNTFIDIFSDEDYDVVFVQYGLQ